MFRRLFTFLSLLSLLLATGTVGLWLHSRGSQHQHSQVIGDHRYTFRSINGSLMLAGPPPPANETLETSAATTIRSIRNRDIGAVVMLERFYPMDAPEEVGFTFTSEPMTEKGSASYQAELLPVPNKIRPLLVALEDPSRYAAAHVLLCRATARVTLKGFVNVRSDLDPALFVTYDEYVQSKGDALSVTGSYFGLNLTLRVPPDGELPKPGPPFTWCVAHPDPNDLPAIRDYWHQQLDVPIAAVSYPTLLAITLILPALWLATTVRRAVQRRRRLRNGQCLACGYDLRSSPDRCPECGLSPLLAATPTP